jgi:LCP family protein required for cell wall assembly
VKPATDVPSSTPTPTATPTPIPTETPTATPIHTLTAEEIAYSVITPTPGIALFQTCMLATECTPPPAPPIERLQNTENILFLGTDRREGWDNWRTDTIMLLVIDHETDQMAVISFPRDLYVYDPQIGKRKINVFDYLGEKYGYNEGGFEVIKDVFEYNFGIPVDHVVRAHRGAFVEFVDAIGGIDVTLDCDLWEISPKDDGGYYVLYLPAGVHHLDGETALQFATYRYRTSDWGRARRQQAVLAAMKNQALQLGLIAKAPQLWDIVKRNVSSDIGFLDMLRYAQYGVDLDMSNIHSHVFSNRELTYTNLPENGAYVLFPKDKHSFSDVLENIFAYVPISVQGTHQSGCPPTPTWADDYLAALTPTPSP